MTDREITVACRQIGVPRPPTLPGDSAGLEDLPVAAAEPWVHDLLTTLASPQAVVFAHCQETGQSVSIAVFAVAPPWAVEQLPEQGAAYGLSLFRADEVLQRVGAYCRLSALSARNVSDAGCCVISGTSWLEIIERAASDLPSAVHLMRAEGVATADRNALGAALASCERMAQVTVVQHPTTTRLEGSSTSWLDGGAAGLWEIEAPKLASSGDHGEYGDALLERASLTLRPVSDERLLESIARGLPAGVT